MLPVHKLVHVPSARIKKLKKRENLSEGFRTGGDLEKSALKRNVEESMSKYGERFKAIGFKPIEDHFNSVLQASELGRKTSLGLHLNYKFTSVCQQAIALEHDYCLQSELVITPGNRPNNSSIAITTFSADKSNELTNAQKMTGSKILVDYINDFSDIEQLLFFWKSKPEQRNLMHHWLISVVNTWFKLSYKCLVLGLDM